MDLATIAIICMILGLILLIIEAATPGFFAVIPGAVLVIIGLLGYFVEDFFTSWYLPATAIVVTLVVTAVTIKGYQMLARPEPPETTVMESLVGKTGTVTQKVEPGSLRGKVKIDSDLWSATSESTINEGTEIEVYAAEGVHIKVRPK